MASTSARVVVHLADLGQVQNLVAASARIIAGPYIRAVMAKHPDSMIPIRAGDLVELFTALEALEAAKK